MGFGETVHRDRRQLGGTRYRPTAQKPEGSWDPALTIPLPTAFVASTSSSALRDATRGQVLTLKSLFLRNPDADVKVGDRIRVGGTKSDLSSGVAYLVEARPEADRNPFTGRRPVVEIPLTLVEG